MTSERATADRAVTEMSNEDLVYEFAEASVDVEDHRLLYDTLATELLCRLNLTATERPTKTVTIPMNEAMGMLRTLQWVAIHVPHLAPPGNAAHALAMSNAIDRAALSATEPERDDE